MCEVQIVTHACTQTRPPARPPARKHARLSAHPPAAKEKAKEKVVEEAPTLTVMMAMVKISDQNST